MVTDNESVARVVRDRMDETETPVKRLATETHIPRVTLIRRLSGTSPFTIPELERVAERLETTVPAILDAARRMRVA